MNMIFLAGLVIGSVGAFLIMLGSIWVICQGMENEKRELFKKTLKQNFGS